MQRDIAKVHENLFREDVNPIDEARFLLLLKEKHSKSVAEIARLIKKSESYVRLRLDLAMYPDYLQVVIREGRLSPAAGYWLNRITNENVRRQYTEFAARQGVNALYARAWFESWERGRLAYNPADQPLPEVGVGEAPQEAIITCLICGTDSPLSDHMLGYGHPECFEEIARIRAASDQQGATAKPSSNG